MPTITNAPVVTVWMDIAATVLAPAAVRAVRTRVPGGATVLAPMYTRDMIQGAIAPTVGWLPVVKMEPAMALVGAVLMQQALCVRIIAAPVGMSSPTHIATTDLATRPVVSIAVIISAMAAPVAIPAQATPIARVLHGAPTMHVRSIKGQRQ